LSEVCYWVNKYGTIFIKALNKNIMAIYFSSNKIPELEKLSLKERQKVLSQAQQKFTVPEKLVLNILKLIMLTPPFLFLARQEWLLLLAVMTISMMLNVLVLTPLKLRFCQKHILKAVSN